MNEVIREMIVLLRSEVTRYSILVRPELADGLLPVLGDRVQLQQVMMNLMINGIDAMKDVDGMRELAIKSEQAEPEEIVVSVSDTGVGLPAQPGGTDLQRLLYYQAPWDPYGTWYRPLHYRIAWWPLVGC